MARLHSLTLGASSRPSETMEHLSFVGNLGMAAFQQANVFQMLFFLMPNASCMILGNPVIHLPRPDVNGCLQLSVVCSFKVEGQAPSYKQQTTR